MAIQVTYRRTRRLSMRIVKNGDVHVSAPIGMPKKEVERFIEEHREWIAKARKKTYESQKRRADFYNKLPLKTREQADDAQQRLQGDDFTLGRLQCQGQVHLLFCLSATVAGMVCRARGGSRTVPSVGTQPQCPFPYTDGQVLPPLEGSEKNDKTDM